MEPLYLELGAPDVGSDLDHPGLLGQVVDVVHVLVAQVAKVLEGKGIYVQISCGKIIADNHQVLTKSHTYPITTLDISAK